MLLGAIEVVAQRRKRRGDDGVRVALEAEHEDALSERGAQRAFVADIRRKLSNARGRRTLVFETHRETKV